MADFRGGCDECAAGRCRGDVVSRTPGALTREVDGYLEAAGEGPPGDIRAVIAPHAGIMFSGPVAAHAYKAAARQHYDLVGLVGPSHFAGFDGVALYPDGAFDSPLGPAQVDDAAARVAQSFPVVHASAAPHRREHSLEMQLPFVRRLMPEATILPLLMGYQTRDTIEELAIALTGICRDRQCLVVASSDLSHYFDVRTAAGLDGEVQAAVAAFDVDGFLDLFERTPSTNADVTSRAAADRRSPSCAPPILSGRVPDAC